MLAKADALAAAAVRRLRRLNASLSGALHRSMPSPTPFGPDFLCVGMVKGATGWLFDQLRRHPDFWIPPIKELRYLNHRVPDMANAKERLARFEKTGRPFSDAIERAFLKEAIALAKKPVDFDKYAALFRFKNGALSGDISPGYSNLRDWRIVEIAARFPQIKVLLLVRDPVARAWSNISMLKREGHFDVAILENAETFRAYFEASSVKRNSFATEVAARWGTFAPGLEFRSFLFDDIAAEPVKIRREILSFLGANPKKKSGVLPARHNSKANQARLTLTPPIKAVLVEQLACEVIACARTFGGRAEEWPARYGL